MRLKRNPCLALYFAMAVVSACAGSGATAPTGSSSVDIAYEMEGEAGRLAVFLGHPVILTLMSTSDLACHAQVIQLKQAYDSLPAKTALVVLTVETREAPFVKAYAEFEKLPFSIGVAAPEVKQGTSPLGEVPRVPITLFISPSGRVKEVFLGVMESTAIVREAERLVSR